MDVTKEEEETLKTILSDYNQFKKNIQTDLEKVKAKLQAQANFNDIQDRKRDKLVEKVGQSQQMFKDLQEEIKQQNIKFGKTKELVESVQPEKLRKELEAVKGSVDKVEGLTQKNEAKLDQFKRRVDSFTEKLKLLKGEGDLLNLQKDVKSELKTVRKINRSAEMHANKIESHYIKFKQSVDDVKALAEDIDSNADTVQELKKEVDNKLKEVDATIHDDKIKNQIDTLSSDVDRLARLTKENVQRLREKYDDSMNIIEEKMEAQKRQLHELKDTVETGPKQRLKQTITEIQEEQEALLDHIQNNTKTMMKLSHSVQSEPASEDFEDLARRLKDVESQLSIR